MSETQTSRPWRDEDTLRRLYVREGKSMGEIARGLGCSTTTVGDWLRRHGIETRTSRVNPPSDRDDGLGEENLRRLYVEERLSSTEIAEETGFSRKTVCKWLRLHGIETRSPEESGAGFPSGENHPNWKGGHEKYRGERWTEQRRKALERDNHMCQRCGVINGWHLDEYGEEVNIHHVRPFRKFDTAEQANDLDNLLTLCKPCHATVEGLPLDTR